MDDEGGESTGKDEVTGVERDESELERLLQRSRKFVKLTHGGL